jgi:hypothetical protein
MTPEIILLALLRTTLFLTLCGGLCLFVLRKIEYRLPHLSRWLWVAVLLTGWCWIQVAVQVPVFVEETAQERTGVSPPVADVLIETHRQVNAVPLFELPIIPTQAGTQTDSVNTAHLDSRFRGNDG